MKRNPLFTFNILLFLFLCIGFFNCGPDGNEETIPAAADFTADNATGIGITINCGDCVVFEDRSTGDIGALFWDFEGGDPATSEEYFRVSVCYKDPGKYDVSLSINSGEDRITKEDYVCVLDKGLPLQALFSAENTEILRGLNVNLTDNSTGDPSSWNWVVEGPGGNFSSNE